MLISHPGRKGEAGTLLVWFQEQEHQQGHKKQELGHNEEQQGPQPLERQKLSRWASDACYEKPP